MVTFPSRSLLRRERSGYFAGNEATYRRLASPGFSGQDVGAPAKPAFCVMC